MAYVCPARPEAYAQEAMVSPGIMMQTLPMWFFLVVHTRICGRIGVWISIDTVERYPRGGRRPRQNRGGGP
ncbi:uncharacterized protein YALI1_D35339g [Yarrowia lipolytica]|uniref:Uncharacterized protein n=1 Tax=Yarrowia lipolytica TaxID=4952 RepID=A0A1D8NGD7_YARLL|nr:hypothetical protein YALI1_D35339g [Yarrowia lipolytica]